MKIGKAIAMCRTKRGLTQTKLAKAAGISVSYISHLERGRRSPSLCILEKLCFALKLPLSILVFLGADSNELSEIDEELAKNLSLAVLKLITVDRSEGF